MPIDLPLTAAGHARLLLLSRLCHRGLFWLHLRELLPDVSREKHACPLCTPNVAVGVQLSPICDLLVLAATASLDITMQYDTRTAMQLQWPLAS